MQRKSYILGMEMSPQKMIALASSIAIEIVKGKTIGEINEISNLLGLINSNLHTYCQQKMYLDTKLSNNKKS